MYTVGEQYSMKEISNGEFWGEYDQLIGLVDGKLEHFTDWLAEMIDEVEELNKEEGNIEDDDVVYQRVMEELFNSVPVAYEGAKEAIFFKGIAPAPVFDVYSTFECIRKESYDTA